MIKGHTTIELKNVKTGEIERYEHNNFMTDAVGRMINFAATHAGPNGTGLQNPYTNHLWLMQGMVCFDQHIANADATIIYPPNNLTPVAYGVPGLTTVYSAAPELGTYNVSESNTSQPLTKTWVYDYNTSQGNGTISCICLTNHYMGHLGFGPHDTRRVNSRLDLGSSDPWLSMDILGAAIPYNSKKGYGGSGDELHKGFWGDMNSQSAYLSFCIDSDEDVKYMFRVDANGLYILKHSMQFEKFSVFQSMQSLQSYEEDVIAGTYTGSYFGGFYNPDDKALYFWTSSWAGISNDTNLTIYKYNMTTKEVTTFTTVLCNVGWDIRTLIVSGQYQKIYFLRNYSSSSTNIEFFKCHDMTTGDKIVLANSGYAFTAGVFYILNGFLYISGIDYVNSVELSTQFSIINLSNNVIRKTPAYKGPSFQIYDSGASPYVIPPYSNKQIVFGMMGDYGFKKPQSNYYHVTLENSSTIGDCTGVNTVFVPNYLATINNLETPIVKTDEKTMKIIYTITAANDTP